MAMAKKTVKKNANPSAYHTINVKLIESRKNTGVLILRASGKFCSHESIACGNEFSKNLNMAFASDRTNFILSLAKVEALDAIGLGTLATFIGKCLESDIKLALCSAKPNIEDRLRITRLIFAVPYFQSETRAIEHFNHG